MVVALCLALVLQKELPGVRFVLSCQYPSGAIGMTGQGPGDRVVPYFGNLACHALLAEYERSKNERYHQAVTDWLDWYGARIDEEGRVFDHDVIEGGAIVAKEGQLDAMDSYASTYLNVLHRWWKAKGDTDALRDRWPSAERALSALQSLRQDNGLTIAKPDYPVMYLMDNTETYAGLIAASKMTLALGMKDRSEELRVQADETLGAIETELWVEDEYRYATALMQDGSLAEWQNEFYPDVMAQLMVVVRLPLNGRRKRVMTVWSTWPYFGSPSSNVDDLVWRIASARRLEWEVPTRERYFKEAIADEKKLVYSFQVGIVYLVPPAVN